jgi:hypothetical protein
MVQLNKRAYAEFDNMVQLKRYYGSTKTPGKKWLSRIWILQIAISLSTQGAMRQFD